MDTNEPATLDVATDSDRARQAAAEAPERTRPGSMLEGRHREGGWVAPACTRIYSLASPRADKSAQSELGSELPLQLSMLQLGIAHRVEWNRQDGSD